jgi:hypothetical protein
MNDLTIIWGVKNSVWRPVEKNKQAHLNSESWCILHACFPFPLFFSWWCPCSDVIVLSGRMYFMCGRLLFPESCCWIYLKFTLFLISPSIHECQVFYERATTMYLQRVTLLHYPRHLALGYLGSLELRCTRRCQWATSSLMICWS